MDTKQFIQRDETCWEIKPIGAMRVPAIIYADAQLLLDVDQKVYDRSYALTTGRNSGFRCTIVGMKVPINAAMTSLNKLRWTL